LAPAHIEHRGEAPADGASGKGPIAEVAPCVHRSQHRDVRADAVVARDDMAFLDRLWADWSPGFPASDHLALVKESLREPANLAAAIGYYRSAIGYYRSAIGYYRSAIGYYRALGIDDPPADSSDVTARYAASPSTRVSPVSSTPMRRSSATTGSNRQGETGVKPG
jgi:hypothetical protein